MKKEQVVLEVEKLLVLLQLLRLKVLLLLLQMLKLLLLKQLRLLKLLNLQQLKKNLLCKCKWFKIQRAKSLLTLPFFYVDKFVITLKSVTIFLHDLLVNRILLHRA
ncbi:MAG: hypothetical protein JWQ96_200 [Segetibacter sp.]|nr:hypothetical protein [Segetibacter sp.]